VRPGRKPSFVACKASHIKSWYRRILRSFTRAIVPGQANSPQVAWRQWSIGKKLRFAACVSGLALAWPSPSGPLGWQRSPGSRVGPEDRFCEAVRNDLRVPLTLEGPAWTMRGVPAPVPVTFRPAIGAPARRPRPGRGAGGRGSGIRRGPHAAGHWGLPCAGRRRVRRARVRRTRRSGPPCNGETPRLNLGRLLRVTLAALPLDCSRPSSLLTAGAVRPGAPKVRP
jgi:hypothetical protein